MDTIPPTDITRQGRAAAEGDQFAGGPAELQPGGSAPPATASASAFASPSFRVFTAGSLVSWVGDWMDLATLNWAVLQLTDSPLSLGVINACRLTPVFVLSLPAGVVADRHDRRRLLIALQALQMLLTFALGALVAARASFALFALVVTARSLVAAPVPVVRNALLSNLVPPAALAGAIAWQTAIMNLSRIVGPALAGLLLLAFSAELVFYINAVSFGFVLLTLVVIRPAPRAPAPEQAGGAVREALTYIRANPGVQSLLLLAVVPMIFGFPYTTMMPLFARDLLHVDEAGYGILLSLAAVGALAGSLWLSLAGTVRQVGRWLLVSTVALGLALLLFVLSWGFLVAAVSMFLVGLLSQVYRTMGRIAIQVQVPDHLRGRILSIALMDRGLIPLGAMMLGGIASWAGALWAGLAMGGGCVAITLLVVAARPQLWHLDLNTPEEA